MIQVRINPFVQYTFEEGLEFPPQYFYARTVLNLGVDDFLFINNSNPM